MKKKYLFWRKVYIYIEREGTNRILLNFRILLKNL